MARQAIKRSKDPAPQRAAHARTSGIALPEAKLSSIAEIQNVPNARKTALFPGDLSRAEFLYDLYADIAGILQYVDDDDGHDAILDLLAKLRRGSRRVDLPSKAPLLWGDREKGTNAAQFTREVYGAWIGAGLTRRYLRDLDPELYHALSVWEHRHPEDRISELPTLAEVIDKKIAVLANEFSPDELRKLGTTLQTRLRRSKN